LKKEFETKIMTKSIVLLHSLANVIPIAKQAFQEEAADLDIMNLVDETVWYELQRSGTISTNIIRRVCLYAILAEQANASGMLTTCSSLSPCFEVAKQCVDIPLIRLDNPVVKQAIEKGARVGLVATAQTTVQPYVEQVDQIARQSHIMANPIIIFCEGALAALKQDNVKKHDEIVITNIHNKLKTQPVDVLILCQASLHHLVGQLTRILEIPILSALSSAIQEARERVE
jgi:Asp/Glu/hydantoin racemase